MDISGHWCKKIANTMELSNFLFLLSFLSITRCNMSDKFYGFSVKKICFKFFSVASFLNYYHLIEMLEKKKKEKEMNSRKNIRVAGRLDILFYNLSIKV